MAGSWLQASKRERQIASFRPAGMSDGEDDEDEYDFGSFTYGGSNNCNSGRYEENESDFEEAVPTVSTVVSNVVETPLGHVLKLAIAVGSIEEVQRQMEKLKQKDFDVNKPLDDEWNALLHACYIARPDVLKMLFDEGANHAKASTDHVNGMMALACSNNENREDIIRCAQMLLEKGMDLNEKEYQLGASALHFAVKSENLELLEFLCQKGADVNIQDGEGRTPLDWAAARGFGPIVRILLGYEADLHKVNKHGLCAYEVAAFAGFPKLAKVLYLYGKAEDKQSVDLSPLTRNEDEDSDRVYVPQNPLLGRDYVGDILCHLRLQKYMPAFREHGITLPEFLQLRDEDLLKLGVFPIGERIKLMDNIRQIHNYDWKPTSLMSLSTSKMTASETQLLCENLKTHLELMTATMKYLNAHAVVPPEKSCLLNPGLENREPGRTQEYCGKVTTAVRSLLEPLSSFRGLISKFKNDDAYRVGDVISGK